jgi:hypothetical protein
MIRVAAPTGYDMAGYPPTGCDMAGYPPIACYTTYSLKCME